MTKQTPNPDVARFDETIRRFFFDGLKNSLSHPRRLFYFASLLLHQMRASRRRQNFLRTGISVPPIMILSVTRRCNLSCSGCYSAAMQTGNQRDMSPSEIDTLLTQSEELGVGIVMIAGGEPFLRRDVIDILCRHQNLLFPIFTNGLSFDDTLMNLLRQNSQLFPIISMEGGLKRTDCRRGAGVYQQIEQTMRSLQARNIPYGISITATAENLTEICSDTFIEPLIRRGCLYVNYVEYVPTQKGTNHLVLSPEQQNILNGQTARLSRMYSRLFLAFPGNEAQYGGCLAAGRGFIHVNPSGNLEPCPFAPFSDTNLTQVPLRKALSSKVLHIIRNHHHLLSEGSGGCALWSNRQLVESLISLE